MNTDGRPRKRLTQADKEQVFRIATKALPKWYADQIRIGMADVDLINALQRALGTFGGSCGPQRLCVIHQASGLKIWGGWHIVNHVTEAPLFKTRQTLEMARYLYNIANPDDQQLSFF
jgi:hypothetical protein